MGILYITLAQDEGPTKDPMFPKRSAKYPYPKYIISQCLCRTSIAIYVRIHALRPVFPPAVISFLFISKPMHNIMISNSRVHSVGADLDQLQPAYDPDQGLTEAESLPRRILALFSLSSLRGRFLIFLRRRW